MLRLILVALVASTLIGCAGREDSGLGYNFGVYVDRAELPNSSCQLDIGLVCGLGLGLGLVPLGFRRLESSDGSCQVVATFEARWVRVNTLAAQVFQLGGAAGQEAIFSVGHYVSTRLEVPGPRQAPR